jgi:DNA-binding transcriptional regulator YhcF (GntR family)
VVDAASSTPVHEQLTEQVQRMVIGGLLPPGTRLPSIRQLANDLGIAPGTVARTYRDLETAGVVRTRRPQGTFVSPRRARTRESTSALQQLAQRFAEQARQLGVSADQARDAVDRAFAKP